MQVSIIQIGIKNQQQRGSGFIWFPIFYIVIFHWISTNKFVQYQTNAKLHPIPDRLNSILDFFQLPITQGCIFCLTPSTYYWPEHFSTDMNKIIVFGFVDILFLSPCQRPGLCTWGEGTSRCKIEYCTTLFKMLILVSSIVHGAIGIDVLHSYIGIGVHHRA